MSDKIREFIEVPQQFIRDGNQVHSYIFSTLASLLTIAVPSVPYALHKTFTKGLVASFPQSLIDTQTICARILSNLQGSSSWLCSHGLHWILCETNPHPNVRH